jgi:hypothetical protein
LTKYQSEWRVNPASRSAIYAASALALIVLALVLFKNFASQSNSNTSGLASSTETKTQPAPTDQSDPKPSKADESLNRTKEVPPLAEPSTDRDHPTLLARNEIKRFGLGERGSHFYSFTAGPGELKSTFDVEGGKIQIKLYNNDWEELLDYSEYAPNGSKRKVERVLIPRRQTVTMEVCEWVLYGDVVKSYLVRLEGAAQF